MMPILPINWRPWVMYIAMMPFRPRTAHMPQPKDWRAACPPVQVA